MRLTQPGIAGTESRIIVARPRAAGAIAPSLEAGRSSRPRFPAAAVLALDAALLTMIGASIRGDLRLTLGIPVTVAACAVAWAAARRHPGPDRDLSRPYALLAVTAAIGVMVPLPRGPWWYQVLFHLYPLAGLIAVGIVRGGDARQRRRAVMAMVSIGSLLCLLAPLAVPHPAIDVWYWIQATSDALMHGRHPYTVTGIDPSHGAWDFGSTPAVFPYMPAVILLSMPGVAIFGDYRYALALWIPASVVLFRAAARRLRVDSELADVATLAIAVNPRALLITINGQTDLFLVPVATAFLWCAARGWQAGEAIAFLMLPAIKQYVAAPAIIYAGLRRRPRALAIGALVVAATVLPFAAWNREATVNGILYLLRAPISFRTDSDSLATLVGAVSGWWAPRWLGIAGQLAAGAIAGWMLRDRGTGGVLLASAISLLVCFLLATQAFANYYLFVATLFGLSAAALASPAEGA